MRVALQGRTRTVFILIVILAIAIFFRYWDITSVPPALYPDEAVNGVNALEALETGDFRSYYPDNNGREGLFMNLQALSLHRFGPEPWALRVVSGVFGVLAVLGLFFFAREFLNTRVALLSSYLGAISFWAVNFSRIGFRAVMLPAVLVWSFYFLWLGMKRGRSWAVLVSGLIYGIGFHTYISYRISPLLLMIIFIVLFVRREFAREDLWRWAFLFTLGTLLTASPLALYYMENPADFMGRAAQVSIFEDKSPLRSLLESVVKTLGMFNVYGDGNWRHNIEGRPLLFFPVGLAFLWGIFVSLKRALRKDLQSSFLLLWLAVMLIPNFFAPEGAPHALRALGALPAVLILSALGLVSVYDYVKKRVSPQSRNAVLALSLFVLLVTGLFEARAYFFHWASRPEVRAAFEEELTGISLQLNLYRDSHQYVLDNSGGVAVYSVRFLTWENRDRITFVDSLSDLPSTSTNVRIVLVRPDEALLRDLEARYPGASRLPSIPGILVP
jgi:4-amino-4-deoxy-L-arabinose transferase-like glycosyltransferase